MKKLFLTLLTIACSLGMWAEDTVLINYEHADAVTTGVSLSGTTAIASVKIHTNTDSKKCIQLKNGYTTEGKFNGNAIYLTTAGGFQVGDVLTIAGYFSNDDNTKVSKVDVFTVNADTTCTVLWTSNQFVNGKKVNDDPVEESYTLTTAMDTIKLGRNGNTGTNLYTIKVVRPVVGATKTIYFSAKELTGWENDNAYLCVWDGSNNVELEKVETDCTNDHLYSAEVSSSATTLYFKRCNPADHNTTWNEVSATMGVNTLFSLTATSFDDGAAVASVYAAPAFTVNYKANDGSAAKDVVVSNLHCGDTIVLKAANTFVRENWTFVKWSDQDGVAHQPGDTLVVSSDMTLWAHWETWSVYGDFNADEAWEDYYFVNGEAVVAMAENATVEFKLKYQKTDVADVFYGVTGPMTAANCTDWVLYSASNNCSIVSKLAGNYVFSLVNATPTISVTYPVPAGAVLLSADVVATAKVQLDSAVTSLPISAALATVNGGAVTANDPEAKKAVVVDKQGSVYYFAIKASKAYFHVELADGETIHAGDIITATMSQGDRGLRFSASAEYSSEYPGAVPSTTSFKYVVAEGDDFVGETGFNIYRATGNSTYFTDFKISRPATVATPAVNAFGFGTFSCEYNAHIVGAKVYTAALNGNVIECTEVESGIVPAGQGVILYKEGTTEAFNAVALGADEAEPLVGNSLKATTLLGGALAELESCLVLSGNEFVSFTGSEFVAGKAYLPYAVSSVALRIVMPSGIATEIEKAAIQTVAAKRMVNGKLYILREGSMFDINGMLVK